jgi:uncharacterized protein YbjT (DUF2867 family)
VANFSIRSKTIVQRRRNSLPLLNARQKRAEVRSPMPWIATQDVGAYAPSRLAARDFSGSSIQELHGQRDISMQEAASVVGNSIGKPDLGYVQMPSTMFEPALLQMGLQKKTADLIIEMWNGANARLIVPQERRSAINTTPTTLEWFVERVFAPAYLHII